LPIPLALRNLTLSDAGVEFPRPLADSTTLTIVAREIRRSRTGMHALMAITAGEKVLGHDTFNVGRSEDRTRLANRAHSGLSALAAAAYSKDDLRHDLDLLTLWLARHYEQDRFELEEFDPLEPLTDNVFLLRPYILANAGTVMFADPGAGKSYLAQTMGVCMSLGLNGLFDITTPVPVAYVNLERNRESMLARETKIRAALRVSGGSNVKYMHARGQGLPTILPSLSRWGEQHPAGVVILDSISRTGLGDLIGNETGNLFINHMNALGCAWLGIGHPTRNDKDHMYGSIMFDAGEDIGIQIMSERKDMTRGIALKVVKANDIDFPPVAYYALEFAGDGSGLANIRQAGRREFPELAAGQKRTRLQQIEAFLDDQPDGAASTKEVADALEMQQPNVSKYLHTDAFRSLPKEGKTKRYARAAHGPPDDYA